MLQYEVRQPQSKTENAPLIVLMHGRGANRFDLLGLADHLPAHATLVFPEAPFNAAAWGYGPGSAWYKFLGRNKPEPDSFGESLDALHELILHFGSEQIFLGGFSQGGTMSLGYTLSHPQRVRGVLNFSGFLADHPRVVVDTASVRGTSFFWGHGVHDTSIPFDLAVEGRAQLLAADADLTAHDYDIGHWIDPQELADATAWLAPLAK